jgi:hypothetical protein
MYERKSMYTFPYELMNRIAKYNELDNGIYYRLFGENYFSDMMKKIGKDKDGYYAPVKRMNYDGIRQMIKTQMYNDVIYTVVKKMYDERNDHPANLLHYTKLYLNSEVLFTKSYNRYLLDCSSEISTIYERR